MGELSDPFFEHASAREFLGAALASYDDSGDAYVSDAKIDQLAREHGLARGEAAALAFLARNRVQKAYEEMAATDLSLDVELYLLTNEREG